MTRQEHDPHPLLILLAVILVGTLAMLPLFAWLLLTYFGGGN